MLLLHLAWSSKKLPLVLEDGPAALFSSTGIQLTSSSAQRAALSSPLVFSWCAAERRERRA